MFDFNKPKIEITEISDDKKYGRFVVEPCLLYTSPSPRDGATSRMPSSA